MDTTTRVGTALRQRMIDDMRMRKLEPRTREAYKPDNPFTPDRNNHPRCRSY